MFLVFIPGIAIQFSFKEIQVCSPFWCGKLRDRFGKGEKTLIFENWNADKNSSAAISVFCFNTSTNVSSFELTLVDPLIKLNNWFVWYEAWNGVGELSKSQIAMFLIFTEIKWTFVFSTIPWSFFKSVTYQNKTAAYSGGNSMNTVFTHLIFRLELSWEGKS